MDTRQLVHPRNDQAQPRKDDAVLAIARHSLLEAQQDATLPFFDEPDASSGSTDSGHYREDRFNHVLRPEVDGKQAMDDTASGGGA